MIVYSKVRQSKIAEVIIIGIRFLVGFAFIPSGLTKLLNRRFTPLSADDPISYFFDALYQATLYWNFLGFCQVFTAFLLFTQRFATLGAVLFCGIICNIFVITVSMNFKLTWVITLLMLCAGILLLAWDWHKVKILVGIYPSKYEIENYKSPSLLWQIIGLLLFIVFTILMRSFTA
ncbi:DoxX family membrane protein [Myroides sp. WP-1]|uniref:DoxX family membrane protein n=1 Tax=Myroides sp. WP-1 TaxID=2759944 RepID=UPI001C71D652|nr:DoxX family membrane protein [Myroides sp. WP-1]